MMEDGGGAVGLAVSGGRTCRDIYCVYVCVGGGGVVSDDVVVFVFRCVC